MQAQTFPVIHSFSGPPDGSLSLASLIFDSAGNLYGTTAAGGQSTRTYLATIRQNGLFEAADPRKWRLLHHYFGCNVDKTLMVALRSSFSRALDGSAFPLDSRMQGG